MSGNMRRDRRVVRTRGALVGAFNRLFLGRRLGATRVGEIVSEADVGRSTFYEHYSGADELFLAALAGPFAVLADAAAGRTGPERLEPLLAHFWENRQRGRELLAGRREARALRLLTDLVEERLADRNDSRDLPVRFLARQCAEAAFGPLRAWLGGEASCSAAVLAGLICNAGERLTRS